MDNVVQEIEAAGADYLAVSTDVTSETSVRALMKQVYDRWGRIDVLVLQRSRENP